MERSEAMASNSSVQSSEGVPPFSAEIERSTAPVYERLRSVIPEIEWPVHAPYIAAINELKLRRKAIILAHNYQTPEIYHGVADLTGDSLALARAAEKTDAEIIVLCGVHFMAETAKLLNPEKVVLIPDLQAGCSLASGITAEDVRELRRRKTPTLRFLAFMARQGPAGLLLIVLRPKCRRP